MMILEQIEEIWRSKDNRYLLKANQRNLTTNDLSVRQILQHYMSVSSISEKLQKSQYEALKRTNQLYRFFKDTRTYNTFHVLSANCENAGRFTFQNLKALSQYQYIHQKSNLSPKFISLALKWIIGLDAQAKPLSEKQMKYKFYYSFTLPVTLKYYMFELIIISGGYWKHAKWRK